MLLRLDRTVQPSLLLQKSLNRSGEEGKPSLGYPDPWCWCIFSPPQLGLTFCSSKKKVSKSFLLAFGSFLESPSFWEGSGDHSQKR